MKVKLIFSVMLIICCLFSCKKKDTAPDNTTPSTTGSTTGNPTLQPNGTGTTNYDVLFEVVTNYAKYNGNYLTGYSSNRALFCAVTVTNEVQLNLSDMGTVKLNNITFANHFGANNYYYNDSTNANISAPYIWSCSGSSSISALTFTNTTAFPVYSSYTSLPDSISKSSGFTINFNGLGGCDFVQVTLLGPTGSQYLSPKIVAGNANSLTYSPSELTGMNTGTGGYFSVKLVKDNVQTVSGKMVNVRSGISYTNISFKIKP